jgi:hypothetical protein
VSPPLYCAGMFAGVKTPFLLPILRPEYVVDRIMSAVKSDAEFIVLPRLFWLVGLLRTLLPTWLFDWIGYILGATSSMDTFRGRNVGTRGSFGSQLRVRVRCLVLFCCSFIDGHCARNSNINRRLDEACRASEDNVMLKCMCSG